MTRREDAREMAAVLDKAREISRNEPSADWSEAEWKELMGAAVSQALERKPAGRGAIWKPALSYGTLALVIVAIIGLVLKNTIFRPAASSELPPVIAQKPVSPSLLTPETPPDKMPSVVAQKPAPSPLPAIKAPPAAPREEGSQDVVSVKLVSPETGLQIVWFLDKNFEWKGESK